ncbi:MAG: hypothetical protein ACKVYV_10910 [Limisphaerales bacterium]
MRCFPSACLAAAWFAAPAPAVDRVLYSTGFEPAEGFQSGLTLVGQGGWIGSASWGNGLVTGVFADRGQQAFVGFNAPTNTGGVLNAWRPLDYTPGGTNPPVVVFTTRLAVIDSTQVGPSRDRFRWSVYNRATQRLCALEFDNETLQINYALDDGAGFRDSGLTFTNSALYELELRLDFAVNRWAASLTGVTLVADQPLTTVTNSLTLGDIDAVWEHAKPAVPGDNYMAFDDFKVVATGGEPPAPPTLQALQYLPPAGFLLRVTGRPGVSYIVEGTTNFVHWTALKTNTAPDGVFEYLDATGGRPWRFYRAKER